MASSDSPQRVFTAAIVMDLAGPASYLRGAAYVRDGRVEPNAGTDIGVSAIVRGSLPYVVHLRVDGGQPSWSCSCPAAEDGSFCKHCVAVALHLDPARDDGAWLDEPDEPAPAATPDPDLDAYVAGLDHDRLVELVMEQTDRDRRLCERLLAEARAAVGEGLDIASWRLRLDRVFAPYGDFVDYREAASWAHAVGAMVTELEELCDAGFPEDVSLLAEHAHRLADEATQYVDDSDGCLTDISTQLADLHLRACADAALDPVELAARLLDLELTSELDGFHRAALDYADVLGEAGLAEYQRLLKPRWADLAAVDPGGFSTERFRVREALIGVARAQGDADALIAVHRSDLRTPDAYLEIAQALGAAGRVAEAERWAHDGLAAHRDSQWHTPRLREFLAGLLRDRGDFDGAIGLFWDAFEQAPSVEGYRRLLTEAGDEAAEWSARAVATVRTRVTAQRPEQDTRRAALPHPLSTVLVEVLLYEGRAAEAWQIADEHGCDDRVWLTLARAVENSQPLDAIGVYERVVFGRIEEKKRQSYSAAVDLLTRIRRLAAAADRPDRFADMLTRVRTQHKAKRSLMAMLTGKGW